MEEQEYQDNSELEEVEVEAEATDDEQEEQQETEFVEFTPAQQKRFNEMYAKAKTAEEEREVLLEMVRNQQNAIEELRKFQQNLSARDFQSQIAQLQQQEQEAFESGDYATYRKINAQLVDLRLEAKLAEREQATKPKAVEKPALPPEVEAVYVQELQKRDASGNLIRPWVEPTNPYHEIAAKHAFDIEDNYSHLSPQQQIAELDRRMAMATKKTTGKTPPSVLPSGNLTKPRKSVELEQVQLKLARKAGLPPEKLKEWVKGSQGGKSLRVNPDGTKEWF